jgi:hypothetical protein
MVAGVVDVLAHLDMQPVFETLTPDEGAEWRRHAAAITSVARSWESGLRGGRLDFAHFIALHKLLSKVPNAIVPRALPRLTFITDPKLRDSIGRDVDSLDVLVRGVEWKAATVIGGSVVEALLFDRLLHGGNDVKAKTAEAGHVTAKDKGWHTQPLDKWGLWKLIAVARELGLIDDTVAKICDGVRDYRNLIHAGRERVMAPCDRGTALAAAAAVESLVALFSGSRP